PPSIELWIFGFQFTRHHRGLRLAQVQACTLLKPSDSLKDSIAAVRLLRVDGGRDPDSSIALRKAQSRWHYPDHCRVLTVYVQIRADHTTFTPEFPSPQRVRQQSLSVVAALVLARHECPPNLGIHPQNVKETRRNPRPAHVFCRAGPRDVKSPLDIHCQPLK